MSFRETGRPGKLSSEGSELVYFGRSCQQVAIELIAYWSPAVCERIARYQVKSLAFRASPSTAALIAFWAGVLALSHSELPPETLAPIRANMAPARVAALKSLERRSKPQLRSAFDSVSASV